MIKGFLFDYDGVMTATSGNNPVRSLSKIFDVDIETATEWFLSFWHDYLRGKVTDNDAWQMLETKGGRTVSPEQRHIWTSWDQLQPLAEMQQFVNHLRESGFPVGLLTNVTPTTEEEVRTHDGYEGFDFLIRSCKVGFAKPDIEIYQLALSHFAGLKPEEVVFIDDRERFLEPAKQLGMHTIQAYNPPQVIADLRKLFPQIA